MMRDRVLVVGMGSAGTRHAAIVAALGCHVETCDDAQRGMTYPTLASALASQPTRIIVATPASTHARLLSECLTETDAAILVEKPLALSVADLSDGLGVETAADIPSAWAARVTVGYNWRAHPSVAGLRTALQATHGAPTLHLQCHTQMAAWPGQSYASPLLECSHEIDLALWLLGPASVVAAHRLGRAQWRVVLQHHIGHSIVHIDADAATPRREHLVDDGRGQLVYAVRVAPDGEALQESYRRQAHAWLGGRPACGFTAGLAVLALCDTARRLTYDAHMGTPPNTETKPVGPKGPPRPRRPRRGGGVVGKGA